MVIIECVAFIHLKVDEKELKRRKIKYTEKTSVSVFIGFLYEMHGNYKTMFIVYVFIKYKHKVSFVNNIFYSGK